MRDAIKVTISELQASREDLEITLNSIGDAVIVTTATGGITTMNPIAEQLTGWSKAEAQGKNIDEVFIVVSKKTREPILNTVERVIAKNEIVTLDENTLLVSKDGSEYQISDSGAPILNDTQAIVGVVIVFRDITEKKLLEEKLFQSQKMEAVGELAGGVAHDFNNMLSGILGSAELLKDAVSDDQSELDLVNLIITASSRAAELTGKLLAFSRKGTVEFDSVDLHTAIREAISLLKHTIDKKIDIMVNFRARRSTIEGDLSLLQNMLLNLGVNASHAMKNGGKLSFVTKDVHLSTRFCIENKYDIESGDYLKLDVEDSGDGIDPEFIDHIFEPFFTTKKGFLNEMSGFRVENLD